MDQRYQIPALMLAALLPAPWVIAADYLSVNEAQKAIFPQADAFQEVLLPLSAEQTQALLARAGPRNRLMEWYAYGARLGAEYRWDMYCSMR